jgi:ADP-ribose pyrophosphatase
MTLEVHETKDIYRGKIFDVAVETITLPNGLTKNREVVRHPGAAAMVPLLDDGHVILVKQYRHAVGRFLWEIPAGTLEPAEDPPACAHRELVEEIGYEAARMEKITEILPAPGYTDERIHIFLATGLTLTEQNLEDDEILDVEVVSLERALEMIRQGEIQDGKSIVGILLYSIRKGKLKLDVEWEP